MDSGENSLNYVEYTVARKPEGMLKVKRAILMTAYIIFIPIFIALLAIPAMRFLMPIIAITPIFLWMFIFFTWRYVSIDNKYEIKTGVFNFTEIYGKPKKDGSYHQKLIVAVPVKDMTKIAPIADAKDDKIDVTYNGMSSSKSSDGYFADFKNADGKNCRITFDATGKMLKIMKIYIENKENLKIIPVRF